jgi:threonine dehydrogenase-like Zn-dependent dehydrogenase
VLAPDEVGQVEADVVVDAVGSQLPAALEVAARGGRVLLFGMNERARAEVAQSRITRDELTILGSYVGQDVFPDAIRLLEQGRVDWSLLVTHRVGVEELPDAVEELRAGRALKVEVEF